jgi:hypothetical protein
VTSTVAIQRAVLASDLPAPARLIVHTLVARADFKTGVVPAEHTPSLTDLTNETGLARSSVAKFLNKLETAGWVERDRPTVEQARGEHARTGYRLAVGGSLAPDERAKASPPDELVRDTDQPASPPKGPDLVRDADQAGPPSGRSMRKTPTGSTQPSADTSHDQPPAAGEPTPQQRAFGIARGWIDHRAKEGTPVVVRGRSDPLHALRRLIEPFTGPYSDNEIKRAMVAIGESIPSAAQLDRELARHRRPANGRASPSDLREHNGSMLSERTIARLADNARFQAMDATAHDPLAIEGTRP